MSVEEPRSFFATRHVYYGIRDESCERSCGHISSFSFITHEQRLAGNLLCGIVHTYGSRRFYGRMAVKVMGRLQWQSINGLTELFSDFLWASHRGTRCALVEVKQGKTRETSTLCTSQGCERFLVRRIEEAFLSLP